MTQVRYIQTRQRLQSACDALSVAYWTLDPFHTDTARESLFRALCGAVHGPHDGMAHLIKETLDNEMGSSFTTEALAEAVLNALLDYAVPTPNDKKGD